MKPVYSIREPVYSMITRKPGEKYEFESELSAAAWGHWDQWSRLLPKYPLDLTADSERYLGTILSLDLVLSKGCRRKELEMARQGSRTILSR